MTRSIVVWLLMTITASAGSYSPRVSCSFPAPVGNLVTVGGPDGSSRPLPMIADGRADIEISIPSEEKDAAGHWRAVASYHGSRYFGLCRDDGWVASRAMPWVEYPISKRRHDNVWSQCFDGAWGRPDLRERVIACVGRKMPEAKGSGWITDAYPAEAAGRLPR